MPVIFGHPSYDFLDSSESSEEDREKGPVKDDVTKLAFFYMLVLIGMLVVWLIVFFCLRIITLRQKTRVPQERRMYVGARPRQSFAQQEPTIYVSPANLPPPPKYEAMAPPSYEEVVGIHYPNYQAPLPITQPITTAMAQSSRLADNNVTSVTNNANTDATVITVTADDRRTSVTVTASS